MSRPPLLYLSPDDVRRALPMSTAIDSMAGAFKDLVSGCVTMPPRTRLSVSGGAGVILLMPSLSEGISRLGLKFLTLYEGNKAAGLPLIQALVILVDSETGTPLAILDGAVLTSIRTGAVSGAATNVLARPESTVAAIFGAGVQARAQLDAIAAVRTLREARVYDKDAAAASAFAREMSERLGFAVHAAPDAAAALRGADIVSTATTSRVPVFEDRDVADGTHINAVGVYQPDRAEMPPETVRRARVVVDQREAALEEAGDLLQAANGETAGRDFFDSTLGDVLLGRIPGRRSASEITLFKSVGLAVQDLYAASRAYDNALRSGIGIELAR
jgi:ornithine cyclodeaminase/alanine dehydrogenase-like protein (mu-crystallin family)